MMKIYYLDLETIRPKMMAKMYVTTTDLPISLGQVIGEIMPLLPNMKCYCVHSVHFILVRKVLPRGAKKNT